MVNDLYIGNIHYGGQVFKGAHDPIVDEETFNKSVALYNSMDNSKCRHIGRTSYLGSLIFCKQCQARYMSTSYKTNGKTYKYYSCHSRRKINRSMIKDPNCKNMNYVMETLDNMIFDEIRKLANDPAHVHKIRQEKFSDEQAKQEKILSKEIAKIDSQKSRFMDLYGLGEFTLEEVQAKVAPLNKKKEKLAHELELLSKGTATISEEEAIRILDTFEDVMDEGDFDQIRMLLNSLIEKIEIDNEDLDIYWKFA